MRSAKQFVAEPDCMCLTPDDPKPVETVDQTQEVAFVRGIIPIEELDRLLVTCAMVPLF